MGRWLIMAMAQNEIAKTIRDLLVIAKVAMPPNLFAQDPRVIVAMAVLKELDGSSVTRPPNITSRPPQFAVAALAQHRPVEGSSTGISFLCDLPWDLVTGLMLATTSCPVG